ncbi:Inosine-5'-monophosphate dehydrogenase [subsurface metagenome]
MKISAFLKIKGRPLVTIGPNETISVAIQKLVENDIGALPVCDDKGMLLGIISERDLLKEVFWHGGAISSTKVQDVMTKDVAIGTPEDDLDYAASVMRRKRIRHLPVTVGSKLQDILSMRDVVNRQLMEAETEIRYLRSW